MAATSLRLVVAAPSRRAWHCLRGILGIAIVTAAAGCGSMHGGQTEAQLAPYVGGRLSAVVDRYGPPSGDFDMTNGIQGFQWDHFGAGQQAAAAGAVPPRDCRVLIAATPLLGDASTVDFANWVVKGVNVYGGCG